MWMSTIYLTDACVIMNIEFFLCVCTIEKGTQHLSSLGLLCLFDVGATIVENLIVFIILWCYAN